MSWEYREMNDSKVAAGRVDIGGAELYYETSGAGPAVVLLHGHSVDLRMWDAQFASLASRYFVIRYDLRGYGRSDMPEEGRDYLHAKDLHRLMKHLGIGRAHLVGLSLGAFVALDFLHLYPEQALSVSVAGGAIYAEEDEPDKEAQTEQAVHAVPADSVPADAVHTRPDRDDPVIQKQVNEWFANIMDGCGPYKEDIREQLWSMIGDWSAWTLRHKEPRCLVGPALVRGLREREPRTPILVMIGGDDWEGSIRSSEKLLALVPSARRADLADAGHFSNMERPEAFNRALVSFLEDCRMLDI